MTVVLAVFVLVLALAPAAGAAEIARHSGTIVSIPDDARTFVLAEVGPWQVRNGATVLIYRTIELTPETEFIIVAASTPRRADFVATSSSSRSGPSGCT